MVSHCRRNAKFLTGFTLLELLVVLTIAGLLAALVPPLYSNAVPGARLKTTARDFAISLREARGSAIATGSHVDLRLLADSMSYAVGKESAVRLPPGTLISAYDYLTPASALLTAGNTLPGDEINIRFFPDGSSNGAVIRLANSSTSYRIDVSWLLGDVRVTRIGEHGP